MRYREERPAGFEGATGASEYAGAVVVSGAYASNGVAKTEEVHRISAGFGEVVHYTSFFDSSGTIALALGSRQDFRRIELRHPNGALVGSVSFRHECAPPGLPFGAVKTSPNSIMVGVCGESPVVDHVFGGRSASAFGRQIVAWAHAQGMRSLYIGVSAILARNPNQNANAIRSQNGHIAYWTDAEADAGVFKENALQREFLERGLGRHDLWPFRTSPSGGDLSFRSESGVENSILVGDPEGWSRVPTPDGYGLEIPSDESCYFGPARLGHFNPNRILLKLEKDSDWRLVPVSDLAPAEVAVLGVSQGQVIYYSAIQRSVFAASVAEGRTRLSGDHANWLRAGQMLGGVPDVIAEAIREGFWDFHPPTRTFLVARPQDVLTWQL